MRHDLIDEHIRKPWNGELFRVVSCTADLGMGAQFLNRPLDGRVKARAESGATSFIPSDGLLELLRGGRAEDHFHQPYFRRIEAKTSSAGMSRA